MMVVSIEVNGCEGRRELMYAHLLDRSLDPHKTDTISYKKV